MPAAWARHELSLAELLGLSFEDATSRFRSKGPAALCTPLGHAGVAEHCLVTLLPPAGNVSWAAPLQSDVLKRRLPADAAVRAAVKKSVSMALRRASAAGNPPPRTAWLDPVLWDLGIAKKGPIESLCVEAPLFREIGRRDTCVVPAAETEAFLDLQDALLAELGDFAFLATDEATVMLGIPEPAPLNDNLFLGISPIPYVKRQQEWHRLNEELLAATQARVASLERGEGFTFDLSPQRVVNTSVNFQLPPAGSWQRTFEPTLRELMSSRARLVRLLGWPSHLRAVRVALSAADGLPSIDDHQALTPYDAGAELRAYLDALARRCPRLVRQPVD